AKNLYHYFGCGAAGSVLDWLQHTERLTFPQTLVRLRELAGAPSVAAVAGAEAGRGTAGSGAGYALRCGTECGG
ncbi:hypothetical protein HW114_04155, partial [Serratia symbiotica]|nr:hypothetical protein [Serratia symbiotica]